MLYFAAASYSETALRIGKSDLAQGFLLSGRPDFFQKLQNLCRQARQKTLLQREFHEAVTQAITPVNVAGLSDPKKRNWYPVDVADLYSSCYKVDADAKAIEGMLHRCGITSVPPVENR
jgi:FADH2 O2-dependent halogenase